jgi:hypothetical protein
MSRYTTTLAPIGKYAIDIHLNRSLVRLVNVTVYYTTVRGSSHLLYTTMNVLVIVRN